MKSTSFALLAGSFSRGKILSQSPAPFLFRYFIHRMDREIDAEFSSLSSIRSNR